MPDPRRLSWPSLALLVLSAFVAVRLVGGTSPVAWLDTFSDDRMVYRCLAEGPCSMLGQWTSVDGVVHAVGWLQWRAVLAWLGVGWGGVHAFLQALDAVAVGLVAVAATRAGGRIAGAVAAVAMLECLVVAGVRQEAVYNSRPLLFLGAALLVAGVAVARRGRDLDAVAAGVIGALMADTHVMGAFAGISVAGFALAAPARRLRLLVLGCAVFAGTAFLLSPWAWIHSATHVLSGPRGAGGAAAGSLDLAGLGHPAAAVALSGATAVLAWRRRRDPGGVAWPWTVPLWVVVPPLAALVLASLGGAVMPDSKYLAHAEAASAAGIAMPLAALALAGLRRLAGTGARGGRALDVLGRLAPYAAAGSIAWTGLSAADVRLSRQAGGMMTAADLSAATALLKDGLGWSWSNAYRRVKAVDDYVLLEGMMVLDPGWREDDARGAQGDVNAVLLGVPVARVPEVLPPGWHELGRTGPWSRVLALVPSRLDWKGLRVCTRAEGRPAEECHAVEFRAAPLDADRIRSVLEGMPPNGWNRRTSLALVLPVLPGGAHEVRMPVLEEICVGRVASVPPGGEVLDGGSRARLAPSAPGADPGTVRLEWEIGAPGCEGFRYGGFPPFFLEGDPPSVERLSAMLAVEP